MGSASAMNFVRQRPFAVALVVALLLVLLDAVLTGWDLWENFARQGNDDIMRLVMVRDLIAGQGWFDTVQYRVVPPEGLSMHWSRYVDAGIAAIVLPLSYVFPMPQAEVLGAAIWPTLIMAINLCVIGLGTRRLFGVTAACFAMFVTVIWPVTGDLHSAPGNLDHHNIQMLMMTLVGFGIVWPDKPWMAGLVAGLAAAFSLAVGLETLPFVVCAGLILVVRAGFAANAAIRGLLISFCLSLGVGAVLFWLGQAPPATRMVPICDQLGTPFLALIGIAVVASLLPLCLSPWVSGVVFHVTVAAILTGVGILLAWPLLAPCLDGPYGQLPEELQHLIETRITEAMPLLRYATGNYSAAIEFVLPIIVSTVLGFWYLIRDYRSGAEAPSRNVALASLLFLCLMGIGMIFVQMRTLIMAASIVPIVAGYVFSKQFHAYFADRTLLAAVAGLTTAVLVMSPNVASTALKPILPDGGEAAETASAKSKQCRMYSSLVALNEAPPGPLLSQFNFGPSVIWATHHDNLSAGYHRSAASMRNAVTPFTLDEAELEDYMQDVDARYLLLCRATIYESDFINGLRDGAEVDWLRRVPLSDANQILLELQP